MAYDDRELSERLRDAAARIEVPDRALRTARPRVPFVAGAVATALVLLVAVALGQYLGGRRGPSAVGTSATPTATSAAPSGAATASPSPTWASATGVAYENDVLGYRVLLPAPWRHSTCLSAIIDGGDIIGHDLFTVVPERSERDSPPSGTFPGVAAMWAVRVQVDRVPDGTTARAWLARVGAAAGQVVEDRTVAGRPAVRVTNGPQYAIAYYVPVGDRMFAFGYTSGAEPRPEASTPATFEAIVATFTPITPRAVPSPTPAPPAPPADAVRLAAQLADAFAAKDADAVGALIVPTCWFQTGYYQSEGSATTKEKSTESLRADFASGLAVTVEPRSLSASPPMPGSYWLWSTWQRPGRPAQNVQLVLDQRDGRWYWVSALYNAPR